MTDRITLPRADAKRLRNVLRDWVGEYLLNTGLISPEERAALAALEAALAEPPAKREPDAKPETATNKEIDAEWLKITPVLYPMYGLGDFRDGFRAAERFHGIKEDKT